MIKRGFKKTTLEKSINRNLKPKHQMKRMKKFKSYYLTVFILLFVCGSAYGQNRQEKTTAIINKFHFVKHQKRKYEIKLESLKQQVHENDSIKLLKIENQLTEEEVSKRICAAFYEVFNDDEIDDIYNFMQTSGYKKLSNSKELFKVVYTHFSDFDKEIDRITKRCNEGTK